MKFPLPLFVLLLGGLAFEAASAGPVGTDRYELKKRSSFSLPVSTRPPFWPIGWVKPEKNALQGPVAAVPAVLLEEKNFALTSILMAAPPLAVINGRSYMEGEALRGPKGGPAPRILLKRIVDGAVQLEAGTQVVVVKLRRQEIVPRKDEEPTLPEQ